MWTCMYVIDQLSDFAKIDLLVYLYTKNIPSVGQLYIRQVTFDLKYQMTFGLSNWVWEINTEWFSLGNDISICGESDWACKASPLSERVSRATWLAALVTAVTQILICLAINHLVSACQGQRRH